VLQDVERPEPLAAERRIAARRRDELVEVADEEPPHAETLLRASRGGYDRPGTSRPCSLAESRASS
jgi:hypothetical protein